MGKKQRSIGSRRRELVTKSREAALCAIRVFNDPQTCFKSETYIVLMIIAWTYLLHAYYRSKGIEYRYFTQGKQRKRFHRTRLGAHKYWDLDRCLNDDACPLDRDTKNNLRFLITLRHEIEHQMTGSLDAWLSGRYQACALNFNQYMKTLFGKKASLDSHLMFCIQFIQLTDDQICGPQPEAEIPDRLKAFVVEFEGNLTHDEYNNERFSYRLLMHKKLVNKAGQADRVVEFIDPNSDIAKSIDSVYYAKKEVERPKFRATDVVAAMKKAGFKKFRLHEHTNLWKTEDAKNLGKGYGVNVQGLWYWYQSWIDRCQDLCSAAGDTYK